MQMILDEYLQKGVEIGASDIHVCAGLPFALRKNGSLYYIDDYVLNKDDCRDLVRQILSDEQFALVEEEGEIDLSHMISGVGRFRINIYKQRGSYALAIRIISVRIPELSELGLPNILASLAEKQRGLILVTGPIGSGKSTTLAAMVNHINNTRRETDVNGNIDVKKENGGVIATIDGKNEVCTKLYTYTGLSIYETHRVWLESVSDFDPNTRNSTDVLTIFNAININ